MSNKNNETYFVETDVYSVGLLIGKSRPFVFVKC